MLQSSEELTLSNGCTMCPPVPIYDIRNPPNITPVCFQCLASPNEVSRCSAFFRICTSGSWRREAYWQETLFWEGAIRTYISTSLAGTTGSNMNQELAKGQILCRAPQLSSTLTTGCRWCNSGCSDSHTAPQLYFFIPSLWLIFLSD